MKKSYMTWDNFVVHGVNNRTRFAASRKLLVTDDPGEFEK